jgi:hypothetical protein
MLDPSLQLAAAVLGSFNLKSEEVSEVINACRCSHMSEISFLAKLSGGMRHNKLPAIAAKEPKLLVYVLMSFSAHV